MKSQKLFYILLALWVLADLLQAIFTPVFSDEAYYSLYGQFLDWGYYDHPPMVALLTAFSGALFKGNLSIRFATVLFHGGTVWLVWNTLSHKLQTNKDVWTFFAVAASLVMFSVYGFVTTPDAPLLFFTALFFYLYRHYLNAPSWTVALAIGVTLAAMFYSKYMGVLVAGFVLLSNFKLLKDSKLWIAVLLAAVLFMPHILWLLRNEFPSLQYHLIDRNEGLHLLHLLEYLPNQLLVFNPVCLCLALCFCWQRRKTDDLFERACIFTTTGFILFFWVMTVKDHSEPHWTEAASIPMIILLWQELRKEQWQKWLMRGVVPMVIILTLLRFAAPPLMNRNFLNVLGDRKKFAVIHEYCGHTPVVFVGSFQDPSLYHFYTGENTALLAPYYLRRTQFDIWQFDKELQGKPVYVVNSKVHKRRPKKGYVLIEKDDVAFHLHKTESFQGSNRIQANIDHYDVVHDSLYLCLSLFNPYETDFVFNHPEFPVKLYATYLHGNSNFSSIKCPVDSNMVIPAGGSLRCNTVVQYIPDAPIVICLDNLINRSANSKPLKIVKHD
ncbi:MAG: glycosyltransferase family 39 protein [Bacteroidales bacterium]|nr:glycosyltransferase family 39 protein [Bacteroidales bacterium]